MGSAVVGSRRSGGGHVSEYVPIGQRLVASGLIDERQLAWALDLQRRQGGYLGDILVDAGFLTAEEFHEALAEAWGVQRRDLVAEPPYPKLLVDLDVEETMELGWVACDVTDAATVVIASSIRPDPEIVVEVRERFPGMHVEFVACTRSDLDAVALAVRRERLDARASTAERPLVTAVDLMLALVVAGLALVVLRTIPLPVLAVVVAVATGGFVVGGLLQWVVGYAALVEEPPRARSGRQPARVADVAVEEDSLLPLYTVIIRVAGGSAGLEEMFGNFRHVDYPRDRTDAILIVAEDDVDTLRALRATGRRGWARVAKVSTRDFLDVVRACDHGLALARGRYVVAYDPDERPATDQLRRAVAAFEADLVARMEGRLEAEPLVGLRVADRAGPHGPTPLERLAAVDEVVPVDGRGQEWREPVRSPDVTSVHFNMRLLRRAGGFGLLCRRPPPAAAGRHPPRIGTLASHSVRAQGRTVRGWLLGRADGVAELLDELRPSAVRRAAATGGAVGLVGLASAAGAVVMFLAYPVVLLGGLLAAVRSHAEEGSTTAGTAWVGLGIVAVVLAAVVAVASRLLAQRRGWRAGAGALALPAHWLLHAVAAWTALVALVLRPARVRLRASRGRAGR